MPELPEVETVVRQLRPAVVGRRIRRVVVHTPSIVRCETVPADELAGRGIRSVSRRGKVIRIDLGPADDRQDRTPEDAVLLVHLRMTGRLTVRDPGPPADRHDHADIELDDGRLVRFRDMRRFGGWWLMPASEAERTGPLASLGPDALEIGPAAWRELLGGTRQRIKALLLDQRRVAGLGNIYTDEALHAAGIHPEHAANRLSAARAGRLLETVRAVLREAIACHGTTTATFANPWGEAGSFQDRLAAYGRAGEPCRRCGRTLRRSVVAGRGTVHCPRCQRRPSRRRQAQA